MSSKKLLVKKATNRMVTKVRKMELLKMAVKTENKHKQNPISRKKNRSLKKRLTCLKDSKTSSGMVCP